MGTSHSHLSVSSDNLGINRSRVWLFVGVRARFSLVNNGSFVCIWRTYFNCIARLQIARIQVLHSCGSFSLIFMDIVVSIFVSSRAEIADAEAAAYLAEYETLLRLATSPMAEQLPSDKESIAAVAADATPSETASQPHQHQSTGYTPPTIFFHNRECTPSDTNQTFSISAVFQDQSRKRCGELRGFRTTDVICQIVRFHLRLHSSVCS